MKIILGFFCSFLFFSCIHTRNKDADIKKELLFIKKDLKKLSSQLLTLQTSQDNMTLSLKSLMRQKDKTTQQKKPRQTNKELSSKTLTHQDLSEEKNTIHSQRVQSVSLNHYQQIKAAWSQNNYPQTVALFSRFAPFIRLSDREKYIETLSWTIKSYLFMKQISSALKEIDNQNSFLSEDEKTHLKTLVNDYE